MKSPGRSKSIRGFVDGIVQLSAGFLLEFQVIFSKISQFYYFIVPITLYTTLIGSGIDQ